jgi:Ca2+-transporting ATPase
MADIFWHALETEEVLIRLAVDPKRGLSREEAQKRLTQHGPNELTHESSISPITLFLYQFKNILIVILILAVILSALVGEIVDAVTILVIVVFCGILGFVQEYRAERAIEALKKMLSPTVTVLRDGEAGEVESRKVVPGDIVLLEAGDKIPADLRLIETHSLRCDEAPLTGESVPVGKNVGVLAKDTRVSDRKNMALTGTTVTYGRGRGVVIGTGMGTEFGKIAEEVAAIEVGKTPLEKRTDEIGKWLGIICLTICGLVAGISLVRQYFTGVVDLPFIITMIMFAVALAVAAVPEALAAIVTGALALGMQAMAKKNALVRKMPAVETLGCTTVICADKTGTLTRGQMTVRRIHADGRMLEVSGVGYTPAGDIRGLDKPGATAENRTLRMLLEAGVGCNDADLRHTDGQWTLKGDPTEGALLVAALKGGIRLPDIRAAQPRIDEIPFSSERKCMSTLHRVDDDERIAFAKGAPEVILQKCAYIHTGDREIEFSPALRADILKANEAMAQGALRVLGVAYRRLGAPDPVSEETVEAEMVFLGLVGMMDPPREEAVHAVQTCKGISIKPIMITGDHKLTAVAVARELGIYGDGDTVLTGAELAGMRDADLAAIVAEVTVYARVSPTDKLKIVKAWQARGEVVAMTGDGVNDAPALKHADIGVAMGITGTDVAKEASDMVLSDDNFATIVSAIERGRWIYDNIQKYLAYLIQCNVTEVVVIGGIVLMLGPAYLPLLPAAILYINLATDGLPALALGVAPPERDIMRRPPRDPKESFFNWDVKAFILLAVLIESPLFYLVFYADMHDLTRARTVIFFLFIVVESVIAVNCRSLTQSVFRAPPHKWLLIALSWELALVAVLVQIPSVRSAFGIALPTAVDLVIIAAMGLMVLVAMELTKVFLRRSARRP